jgi:hypothetical protein
MTTLRAYLDHNVLDSMLKGDPKDIRGFLTKEGVVAVFSDENLAEIHRSKGCEQQFLRLLAEIGAQHLLPELDRDFRHTGRAFSEEVNPHEIYRRYVDNLNAQGPADFGVKGMLEKFYGGRSSQSFQEIFASGESELKLLKEQLAELLATTADVDDVTRAKALNAIERIEHFDNEEHMAMARQLDETPASAVAQFDETYGLGPKVLNNIDPPNVVRKVWDLVKATVGDDVDRDTFFGLKAFQIGGAEDRGLTNLEKINAIYHQLNFVGYYRDAKMHSRDKFTSSFSDMTHAGLASFCHVLIGGDKNMMMKAAAAYEYVNAGTAIVLYRMQS